MRIIEWVDFMSNGQLVIVRLCGGMMVPRRVITVGRNEVVVCGEDEYQESILEKRLANRVILSREDVVDDESHTLAFRPNRG